MCEGWALLPSQVMRRPDDKHSDNCIRGRYNFGFCAGNGKIYIMGGVRRKSNSYNFSSTFEEYDVTTGVWKVLPSIQIQYGPGPSMTAAERYGITMCMVNDKIYCVGGMQNIRGYKEPDRQGPFCDLDVYDITSETWSKITPQLPLPPSISSCVLEGKLYTFPSMWANRERGGLVRCQPFGLCSQDTAIYDLETKKWSRGPRMRAPSDGAVFCALDGLIYAIGGAGGQCEVYSPVTQNWSTIPSMPTPRSGCRVCTVGGLLYAIGGAKDAYRVHGFQYMYQHMYPDINGASVVEMFDPKSRKWHALPSLNLPRMFFGLFATKASIYVFGGEADVDSFATARGTCEVFDTEVGALFPPSSRFEPVLEIPPILDGETYQSRADRLYAWLESSQKRLTQSKFDVRHMCQLAMAAFQEQVSAKQELLSAERERTAIMIQEMERNLAAFIDSTHSDIERLESTVKERLEEQIKLRTTMADSWVQPMLDSTRAQADEHQAVADLFSKIDVYPTAAGNAAVPWWAHGAPSAPSIKSEAGEHELCCIYMEAPRNATIVHGETGHSSCCYVCAKELKDRKAPCPICQTPIDAVIRVFNS